MKNVKTKNHLTFDMRVEIQECLDKGMSYKAIARLIGKDPTTVSREVKRHIVVTVSSVVRYDKVSGEKILGICPLLKKPPFVCNPCKKRYTVCPYDKHTFVAKRAHQEYCNTLREAREGTALNKEEFYENDRIISTALKNGQHVYHVLQSGHISASKSTVYLHIKKGYMSVSKMDTPRMAKFKTRKTRREPYIPKALKIGRTYEDFCTYIAESSFTSWVEMDTVIGRQGGKAIMTFDFTFCNFMFGILLENLTKAEASKQIQVLKKSLVEANLSFGDIFPVLLTDNGGEFSDIYSFENNLAGQQETHLFFCDPAMSSQKARVEKNHTLFRDIVPKGTSFDDFTQETVNLIFSHVNGVKRKKFNGKSPYDLFSYTFGEELCEIFGISFVPADAVIQHPNLLK
jgi:IS30 family transposase